MMAITIDSEILNFRPLKRMERQGDRITIEQYNQELEEALIRVQSGEYLTQEEVNQLSAKW